MTDAVRADSSEYEKGFGTRVLYDLTAGNLCGFYPSDGADYVELRPLDDASQTMLYARMTGVPDTEYKGISNLITEDDAFRDAQYITVRLMVSAPVEVSSLNLVLRLQQNGSSEDQMAVYNGEVQLEPNEWQNVSFKIKDFVSLTRGDIDQMKLWIKTTDATPVDGEYGIWLENVTLYTKASVTVLGVILWILLILVILVVGGYGVLFARAQYIRKKRREQMELRRRQQLRMQAMRQNRLNNPPPYSQNPNNHNNDTNFR